MNTIDIHEIQRLLPHRYPFLLIDRVIDFTPGEHLVGIKNISYNEPQFTGHFPKRVIMPGVLILESLAQATGLLAFKTATDLHSDNALYYLAGIDNARFKKPVEPGDQLKLEVTIVTSKRNFWKFKGVASVDGDVVVSADILCVHQEMPK
ncbi:MAG: 3-hydroxyacyl-[acyl-carrier-protein] dehydratase FabZ [Gammaproteobacteria bacterium]|nr:MAG: 3-hydroxyacyl-[acyl-carrier-protein] dehydratase FabZ [Gammaproteobacteria bacterium]RKZ97456.1 MAG: 3-hydroxyacyl-[acyl-carrier-protein] dehydratase FabZ [Gammaproteobacteria bacterium]RKZ98240.1 MAG: 3-hydroxyacyl-[acyl-carrier-protein] dehydratase FabZ [Gammaproteobacteria bacterium]HHA18621.1 3-hydroxyacyl-ACP dehydratase FabZ [Methylophaga sp.]